MSEAINILLKRSTTNASPGTTLRAGEPAYSYDSDILYIGNVDGVGNVAIPIGGSGFYAQLDSPDFIGTPTVPTPDVSTNNTTVVNAEWVKSLSLTDFADLDDNLDVNSFKIVNLQSPENNNDAANKGYVDNSIQTIDAKNSVRVKATENINITAPGNTASSFDNVSLVEGDRLLLSQQTNKVENGIYVYQSDTLPLLRASDADTNEKVSAGHFLFVEEGSAYANSGWLLSTNEPITLGTTELEYVQFNGADSFIAGDGLVSANNTISIGTADPSRIVINEDNIDLGLSGAASGDYIGFSVDEYGRVTGYTQQTTLAEYGITDAQSKNATLDNISTVTTEGILVRTDSEAKTVEIEGTLDVIEVVNGNGLNGNPTINIATNYVGQESITTVGTVTTGTWEGEIIGLPYGGTGADLTSLANNLIQVNAEGTALTSVEVIDGGVF